MQAVAGDRQQVKKPSNMLNRFSKTILLSNRSASFGLLPFLTMVHRILHKKLFSFLYTRQNI